MTTVIDYTSPPVGPRNTQPLHELFRSLHREIVDVGPRGVVVVFGVFFSSSAVLLSRAGRSLYQRLRGYA